MNGPWSAAPSGTPGLWVLRRNGVDVGSIALIPGAVALPTLHIDNMVRALNDPPPPELFAGPALDVLDQHRQGQR